MDGEIYGSLWHDINGIMRCTIRPGQETVNDKQCQNAD